MNNRTKIRIFTIIGILLIFFGAAKIIADFYGEIQAIHQVIEDGIIESLKSEGYEVSVQYSFDGYKVYLTLSDENNWFEQASWCGYVATDFLIDMKTLHADRDEQISEYHFEFLKPSQSNYTSSSVYYKPAYTAHYINDHKDPYVYELKIALNKGEGDKQGEAKTYLTYLREGSTRYYDLPDHIVMDGEHYAIELYNNDSYMIKPKADTDLERNPDSSLMWYMDEFSSYFFAFSNIDSKVINKENLHQISLGFNFTNNLETFEKEVIIGIYIYNEQDKVIDAKNIQITYLEPNESKYCFISQSYDDEIPSYFQIVYIVFSQGSGPDKIIVFE